MKYLNTKLSAIETANLEGEIENAIHKLLEKMLKEKAQEIGFEYDASVLDLVLFGNDDKIDIEAVQIVKKLQDMVDEWAKDTSENYPNLTENF